MNRRKFMANVALSAPLAALPTLCLAAPAVPRSLRFYHTHTGEKLDVLYYEHGGYLPEALDAVNQLMRDHRSGEVTRMDPKLLDLLRQVQTRLGSTGTFEIISAYRSPATNEMLRNQGGGVAKSSLHMQGKAIDVRLSNVATKDIRQVGLDLKLGGVGYYPQSNFVHLDTGRVRRW
jgi:uncharacterized protein YcbK (DUF882 family)